MSDIIIGRRGLAELRGTLSERDLDIVRDVDRFRFLSTGQIEQLHFAGHASPLAAARAARRSLERLNRDRVLLRLERRIGGMRAGSASFVYGLGPIGDRLLGGEGPRRRYREPSAAFLTHTLAIADVVVDLTLAARKHELELLSVETEPGCWRSFTQGLSGRDVLRPDLFVAVGLGDFEDRWFIEMDLATESTTTVVRKCHTYHAYHGAGVEQAKHGVFPRVLWIVPHDRRKVQLQKALNGARGITRSHFVVATADEYRSVLGGGAS